MLCCSCFLGLLIPATLRLVTAYVALPLTALEARSYVRMQEKEAQLTASLKRLIAALEGIDSPQEEGAR
jgi:hypothetical protein